MKRIKKAKRLALILIGLAFAFQPSSIQRIRSPLWLMVLAITNPHTLSAHLNLALRDRGFLLRSSSEGVTGFFVMTRITPSEPEPSTFPLSHSRKICFTIRSSREWKEMTHILPPPLRNLHPVSNILLRFSNSSFTLIRRA